MSDTVKKIDLKKRMPPPDVQCTRTKCHGASHHPGCPVYIWAMEEWIPEDARKQVKKEPRKRGHHPEEGQRRLTPEERAAISRENGKKGGRPMSPVPVDLLAVLKKGKFRVKEEYKKGDEISEAAAEVAGWSMERLAWVAAGRISHRKAPSVVKAAQALREEICEPVERTMNVKGGLNLGAAVDAAAQRAGLLPKDEK